MDMRMKPSVFIVVVDSDYSNARKLCERIENTTFTLPNGSKYVRDEIIKDYPDVEGYINVCRITDFMDMYNDDDISSGSTFMTYVYLQVED